MQNVDIEEPNLDDISVWADLRLALWPESDMDEVVKECMDILESSHEVAFLAWHQGKAIGFIEGSLRGTLDQPYGHVEGWYVRPEMRHKRAGVYLMGAIEEWMLHHSIQLMHSDTTADYPLSPKAHSRAGYEEVGLIRIFRKVLE